MTDAVSAHRQFTEGLLALLREAGREVFAPEVQAFVKRIMEADTPCPECRYIPPPPTGLAALAFCTPIGNVGTTHHADCPTVPQMSPEDLRDMNKRLDELAKARIDNRRFL